MVQWILDGFGVNLRSDLVTQAYLYRPSTRQKVLSGKQHMKLVCVFSGGSAFD
jgi:hypothetical protein